MQAFWKSRLRDRVSFWQAQGPGFQPQFCTMKGNKQNNNQTNTKPLPGSFLAKICSLEVCGPCLLASSHPKATFGSHRPYYPLPCICPHLPDSNSTLNSFCISNLWLPLLWTSRVYVIVSDYRGLGGGSSLFKSSLDFTAAESASS